MSKCASRLDAVHILAIGVKGNLCKNVGGCLRLLSCRIWPSNRKVKKRRKSVSRLHSSPPRWPPLVSCSCKIMHFSFSSCFGTLICIDCVHRLYLRCGFLSKCARRLCRKHDSSGGHQDLGPPDGGSLDPFPLILTSILGFWGLPGPPTRRVK